MPVASKALYLAKNLSDLQKKGTVSDLKNNKEYTALLKAAETLAKKAEIAIKEQHDEELAYLYFFRAFQLWQTVTYSNEYKSDVKYFRVAYGKLIEHIIVSLEKHSKNLEKRYADSNAGIPERNLHVTEQFTFTSSIKERNNKGKSEGCENHTLTSEKTVIKNSELMVKPENRVLKDEHAYYGERIFIQCEELKDLITSSNKILIIDIRPREDYELSKISKISCVNIPEKSKFAGLSAKKLGEMIESREEKYIWEHRDEYEQIIIIDWHSEEKDITPSSPLVHLKNSLLTWDPYVVYKSKPLILNGGFECFLDMYPILITNPKIKCPENNNSSTFIQHNMNIEYPIHDLDEIVPKQEQRSQMEEVITSKLTIMPSFDRSTKPSTAIGKTDKYVRAFLDKNESDQVAAALQEEPMEQDKSLANPKEKAQEKTLSLPYSSAENKPVCPDTPPRQGRPYPSASKKILDKGDNDEMFSTERLKSDNMPRGGGLKRSASSPNINKLGDGDLNFDIKNTPKYDRNTKPISSPIYEGYSPRDTGTDTVYLANNKEGIGLTGLKNLGNLCYMNSIMQCISNTVELNNELTKFNATENNRRHQITTEVSALLRNLWQGNTKITNCRSLKAKVGSLRHSFYTNEQQDAHEFLTILMDWLHEDLNRPSTIQNIEGAAESTGEKAWGEFKKKHNSLILDLFYGQLKSTVTCNSCTKQSILFEPFSNLSIPLPPQDTPNGQEHRCSLEECLNLYLKGETITGWVCPSCKVSKGATKKLDITRLPPLLIIHFKRFMNEMVGMGWCRKRMNMVDFPISDFEMKHFTHPDSELRHHKYNLYAVSNHYGSLNSGHYTAYCKNHKLNKWYKFDDQDVSEMLPYDVKTSAAYILFYESVNLKRMY